MPNTNAPTLLQEAEEHDRLKDRAEDEFYSKAQAERLANEKEPVLITWLDVFVHTFFTCLASLFLGMALQSFLGCRP